MKELEMIEMAQKALFEHGPMTLKEIKQHIGKCNIETLRAVIERHENIFHLAGLLKKPAHPPQHIYGLVGVRQELHPEEKKKHPFDLPKHSIIYREIMEQQRVKYERY
jgi:chorismate mutase